MLNQKSLECHIFLLFLYQLQKADPLNAFSPIILLLLPVYRLHHNQFTMLTVSQG